MPGQRKKGKRLVTAWLNEAEMSDLEFVAVAGQFRNRTDALKFAIADTAARFGEVRREAVNIGPVAVLENSKKN